MKKKLCFLALLVILGVPQALIAATAVINDANGTVYEFSSQVVQDVDLVLVSIYEVQNRAQYPDNIANVVIENGGEKPIVLVLSSYEQVHWAITVAAGVDIQEIILNGYYLHDFSGIDASLVTNKSGIGDYLAACGYSYPYGGGGCDTTVLIDAVESFTGLSLSIFAGTYKASDFTVTSGLVANRLHISPSSGPYVIPQNFDLTFIVDAPDLIATVTNVTWNGVDVTAGFNNCSKEGALAAGGTTFRCPGFSGGFLGVGTHTISATVDLSDASQLTNFIVLEVRESVE